MVARKAHNLETQFESDVRNLISFVEEDSYFNIIIIRFKHRYFLHLLQ